jgi:FkbM family methyltransferase
MMQKITVLVLNFFDYFHKKKIINFLKKKFSSLDVVFDVGAHKGESVELFIGNFIIKELYSFEPSFKNFSYLNSNIQKIQKKYKSTNFKIFNFGFGAIKDKLFLKQAAESSSSTLSDINKNSNYYKAKIKFLNGKESDHNFFEEFEVEIKTIDSFVSENSLKKIDLLKIDTEGHEHYVLKGFEQHMKIVKYIMFEHHYDDMLNKKYTFSDINKILIENKFINPKCHLEKLLITFMQTKILKTSRI